MMSVFHLHVKMAEHAQMESTAINVPVLRDTPWQTARQVCLAVKSYFTNEFSGFSRYYFSCKP